MRIVNENLEIIDASKADLSKGCLVEGAAIREDAEGMETKLDIFCAADKIAETEHVELLSMLSK